MAALDALLPMVLPHVGGAPDIAVVNALRQAAIQFCAESHAWQTRTDPIKLAANVSRYEVDLEPGTLMHTITAAYIDGRRLTLAAPADFMEPRSGPPELVTSRDATTVDLYPTPAVTAGLLVLDVTLMPSQTATTIDDAILAQHAQAIARGAAGRLQREPGKPYTDFAQADVNDNFLRAAIVRERTRAFHGHSRSRRVVPPLYF